jgi:hypothetical protein
VWRRKSQQVPRAFIAAGECVWHDVQDSRLVLDNEIKPEQLAGPLMLRDCCQALVEDEAKTPMICANHEASPPKIRSPMPYCLYQTNKFTLVSSELGVSGRNGPAEEGHKTCALV